MNVFDKSSEALSHGKCMMTMQMIIVFEFFFVTKRKNKYVSNDFIDEINDSLHLSAVCCRLVFFLTDSFLLLRRWRKRNSFSQSILIRILRYRTVLDNRFMCGTGHVQTSFLRSVIVRLAYMSGVSFFFFLLCLSVACRVRTHAYIQHSPRSFLCGMDVREMRCCASYPFEHTSIIINHRLFDHRH